MCHGFGAVKEMGIDVFAEEFTTSIPVCALVYDNRNLGTSDGLPRRAATPALQCSDCLGRQLQRSLCAFNYRLPSWIFESKPWLASGHHSGHFGEALQKSTCVHRGRRHQIMDSAVSNDASHTLM
ncbi:hypothetical protein Z517_12128 [Fonsecaea pedrosoi CBS 271.37]|uniref:Uncharacterized protein n=1 Tax=Fonsecaea pedrosoi CBS 271.37 TaxID=1442368 RepID=A0A0D2G067_9EURO|nr:uncharacterized protein Z517_12128 [Fonsecaea pedrosoi CBS 271.37]KIW74188.1 hypothetical protein Z517_12128 [Fonsecaea pedrosoi CBS 271.37]